MAGQIERYHTWPTIRKQNVAEHTWHVLRIYERVFGAPHPIILEYILYHDCGEIKTGDLPFGAKDFDTDLRLILQRAENAGLQEMGITVQNVGEAIKQRVKICDLLEMAEFGQQEMQMGNQLAAPILVDTIGAIDELMPKMAPPDRKIVQVYLDKGGWRI